MKSIKNILITSLLTIGAFSAVTLTSCSKSDDTCPTGYEGTDCKTLVSQKFSGIWTASDMQGSTPLSSYVATITPNSASNLLSVAIGKFSDGYFTNDVVATVSGTSITIASQAPDSDGYTVDGSGSLNTTDNKITWNYTITNPLGSKLSYTGTWSK